MQNLARILYLDIYKNIVLLPQYFERPQSRCDSCEEHEQAALMLKIVALKFKRTDSLLQQ